MEEASVLCDRLGIFVDGQLVCIGAPRELTARHGGYYVSDQAHSSQAVCFVMTWQEPAVPRIYPAGCRLSNAV